MRQNTITLALLILSITNAYSQDDYRECFEDLKAFYKTASALDSKNKPECVQMSTFLDYRSPDVKDGQVDAKVLTEGDKIFYVSNDFSFFKDQRDYFALVHSRKTIFWTNGFSINQNEYVDKYDFYSKYEKLFHVANVVSCEPQQNESNEDIRKITIKLNNEGQAAYGIVKITFTVNFTSSMLMEIKTNYTMENYLKSQRVQLNSCVAGSGEVEKSAIQNVYTSKGTLLPALAGYEIIDNRQDKKF